ncbi:MAG TPA: hypothetical protein VE990_19320 [Acidimicrobiales bacterium]|nr:hypothetical protein [Acidimicrobiales bacterium]
MVAAGLALATLGLSACSYATRKQDAALLVSSAARAIQSGTATGQYSQVVDATDTTLPLPVQLRTSRSDGLALQIDFAHDRAAILNAVSLASAASKVGKLDVSALVRQARSGNLSVISPPPATVFDHWTIYVRQAGTSASPGTSAAGQGWYQLGFADLTSFQEGALHSPTPISVMNPVLLVRLLAGTLSGSVRRIGPATIDGVATTHYRMNVDVSKALSSMTNLSDRDTQAIQNLLVSDNVHDSTLYNDEVWLDSSGRPRRLVLHVVQQTDHRDNYHLTYTLDLANYGTPVHINLPNPDNTNQVSSLNQLLGEIGPSSTSMQLAGGPTP